MSKFDEAIERVLKHEGGFTDDPKDPGNWTGGSEGKGELKGTNYGISAKAYPGLDIENLTIEEAKAIYKKDYWDRAKTDSLPERLQEIYFDMSINMGRSRAVKVLQQASNNKNSNKIDVDGGLGPMTLKAISNVEPERVRSYRVMYYADLVSRKPDLEKFWFGWFRRSLEV